jgi:hypothetical protein
VRSLAAALLVAAPLAQADPGSERTEKCSGPTVVAPAITAKTCVEEWMIDHGATYHYESYVQLWNDTGLTVTVKVDQMIGQMTSPGTPVNVAPHSYGYVESPWVYNPDRRRDSRWGQAYLSALNWSTTTTTPAFLPG